MEPSLEKPGNVGYAANAGNTVPKVSVRFIETIMDRMQLALKRVSE